MSTGAGLQALKRIPRIKFPQRRPKPSVSASLTLAAEIGDAAQIFYMGSIGSTTLGGKASLQPKRTPVSNEEIEAIRWVAASDILMEFEKD